MQEEKGISFLNEAFFYLFGNSKNNMLYISYYVFNAIPVVRGAKVANAPCPGGAESHQIMK